MLRVADAWAAPVGFTSTRKKTFAALIASYDKQRSSLVDTTGRDLIAEQARRYAGASSAYRDFVDALLDALEAAPASGRFSALTVKERRAELTAWYQSSDPRDTAYDSPRPGDSEEPSDIRASNERMRQLIDAVQAQVPDDQQLLDAETLLPRWKPPGGTPVVLPTGDPLGTRVLQLRQLRFDAYRLVATLFSDDRALADEVSFS
jgi:hypothetical protein